MMAILTKALDDIVMYIVLNGGGCFPLFTVLYMVYAKQLGTNVTIT